MQYKINYSLLEKALHKFAFKYPHLQLTCSQIEDKLYAKPLAAVNIVKPVFITSLPRAGTTLLLELLMTSNAFATHTYRNMPFLFMPVFWSKFSKIFQQTNSKSVQERAHGDGMLVHVDSPEAFEEMIWKFFWPSHYKSSFIRPWKSIAYQSFEQFFSMHIRKMIALKSNFKGGNFRYISKNNLNICRILYLRKIFSDAIILVPFRDPLQHAFSILKQHKNFLHLQQQDPFVGQFMEAIGHYDFGQHLKPINFSGLTLDLMKATEINFWLRYWINTYQYLLTVVEEGFIHLISYEQLCTNPEASLDRLATVLGFDLATHNLSQANGVHKPSHHDMTMQDIDQNLLSQARDLWQQLCAKSQ